MNKQCTHNHLNICPGSWCSDCGERRPLLNDELFLGNGSQNMKLNEIGQEVIEHLEKNYGAECKFVVLLSKDQQIYTVYSPMTMDEVVNILFRAMRGL